MAQASWRLPDYGSRQGSSETHLTSFLPRKLLFTQKGSNKNDLIRSEGFYFADCDKDAEPSIPCSAMKMKVKHDTCQAFNIHLAPHRQSRQRITFQHQRASSNRFLAQFNQFTLKPLAAMLIWRVRRLKISRAAVECTLQWWSRWMNRLLEPHSKLHLRRSVCFGMAVASERFKRGWKLNLITIQFTIDCLPTALGKGSRRRKLTIGLLSQCYWWTSWKQFPTKVAFKSHLEVRENNLNNFNRIRGGKRQWGWFGNVKHVIKWRHDMKL